MTEQQSYSYVTLRYFHDAMTGEFLNVGLLLFAPAEKLLRVKTRRTMSRVREVFPDLDRPAFTSAMRSVEHSVARLTRELFDAPLFSKDIDVKSIARRVLPSDDSSLQWSSRGTGITSNIDQTFDRLFSRLVTRYDARDDHRKSDDEVWRPVRQMLEQRDLASRLQEKTIVGDVDQISFKHAWKNGQWHVIEPISLDLADAEGIKQKARRWRGHLSAVAEGSEPFRPLFVVGAPADEDLKPAYDNAVAILRTSPFQPEIFEEDEIENLVDKIEEEVREHDARGG
jgi:Protein of unknown function (DUF3037)